MLVQRAKKMTVEEIKKTNTDATVGPDPPPPSSPQGGGSVPTILDRSPPLPDAARPPTFGKPDGGPLLSTHQRDFLHPGPAQDGRGERQARSNDMRAKHFEFSFGPPPLTSGGVSAGSDRALNVLLFRSGGRLQVDL